MLRSARKPSRIIAAVMRPYVAKEVTCSPPAFLPKVLKIYVSLTKRWLLDYPLISGAWEGLRVKSGRFLILSIIDRVSSTLHRESSSTSSSSPILWIISARREPSQLLSYYPSVAQGFVLILAYFIIGILLAVPSKYLRCETVLLRRLLAVCP
jgi:hypothetical protein